VPSDCAAASIPAALQGSPAARDEALATLRALLLRGTRFELSRTRRSLSRLSDAEVDSLAIQAAEDALVEVVARIESFRGASRFTTWASKFAVHEAGLRRRALAGDEPSSQATP
jgi:RNA polymerase sigma-70 factor (ECF subfamily)